MKKKMFVTLAALLITATAFTACASSSDGVSGGMPAEQKRDSYQSSPAAAYDEEAYESASATEDAYYMDSETIALNGSRYAPDSGSGKEENGSGNDGDAIQTSGGGDVPDPAEQTDLPSGSDKPETKKARKLITTVSIDAETEKMDGILDRIQGEVEAFGGYIEASHISQDRTYMGNDTYSTRRTATLTLRVPEAKLQTILDTVSGETNILEQNRSTEDITLTYVDIESRKKSLETQRESLLRLLEQAETVEDIITIEDRLSYVNYEIERMGGQLRTYDNLVDYATVHLTLREVVEYTPVQEEPDTVFTRIAKGFSYNLRRVGGGIVDLFVWIVSSLPQIVVFVAVVLAFTRILGMLKKRRALRKAAAAIAAPDIAQNPDGGRTADKAKKGLRGLFGKRKQKQVSEAGTQSNQPAEENAEEHTEEP